MYIMIESLKVSMIVSLDAALAYTLFSAFARQSGFGRLRLPFVICIIAGMLTGVSVAKFPMAAISTSVIPILLQSRFFLSVMLLAAGIATRRYYSLQEESPVNNPLFRSMLLAFLMMAGLFWIAPESAASNVVFYDLEVLSGKTTVIWLAACAGVFMSVIMGAIAEWIIIRLNYKSAFTPSSLLLSLFSIKVIGIAAWAAGARPLPMKYIDVIGSTIHDLLHMLFVLFQLPDHPFLKDNIYQGILIFLEPFAHAVIVSLVLTILIVSVLQTFLLRRVEAIPDDLSAPRRRLAKVKIRRSNIRVGAGIMTVIALIWFGILFSESQTQAFYDPEPVPVAANGMGEVVVPLADPFSFSAETKLRKYIFVAGEHTITFFTIEKPDGTMAIALDMCEICQPKGYAQKNDEYIICKYCMTPIPISTVGQPGGCNPIPIPEARREGNAFLVPHHLLVDIYVKGMKNKK